MVAMSTLSAGSLPGTAITNGLLTRGIQGKELFYEFRLFIVYGDRSIDCVLIPVIRFCDLKVASRFLSVLSRLLRSLNLMRQVHTIWLDC